MTTLGPLRIVAVLPCVRGVHFQHRCVQLSHRGEDGVASGVEIIMFLYICCVWCRTPQFLRRRNCISPNRPRWMTLRFITEFCSASVRRSFSSYMCATRTKLSLWVCGGVRRCSGACVVLIVIMNLRRSHQFATLGVPRCASAFPWVRVAHFPLP
jgi:hypothetical protein